ncbi:acyl carrier protein, partial [Klebsiella pneumoniae]|uniref:acyl carrier protein n=1 Tax=Klebsiella pneumoniae TaxID=573 RepID=UPI001BDF7676
TPFELPRTATKKVRRPEVVEMLLALEERERRKNREVIEARGDDNSLWIRKIVATVSNRPLSDVSLSDKLADLGFDSLMFVELQAAVEDA